MSDHELPIEFVVAQILRDIYNHSPYPELIKSQQLRLIQKDPRHVKDREKVEQVGGEYCTTYSTGFIYEGGRGLWWAKLHAYVLKDGSFGAKGRLDPKSFILNGIHYKLKTEI